VSEVLLRAARYGGQWLQTRGASPSAPRESLQNARAPSRHSTSRESSSQPAPNKTEAFICPVSPAVRIRDWAARRTLLSRSRHGQCRDDLRNSIAQRYRHSWSVRDPWLEPLTAEPRFPEALARNAGATKRRRHSAALTASASLEPAHSPLRVLREDIVFCLRYRVARGTTLGIIPLRRLVSLRGRRVRA
jgi:hypothetical protein